MSARLFVHPTALHSATDVARVELRTNRRAMWIDGRRAELLPLPRERAEDLDFSDYTGDRDPRSAA